MTTCKATLPALIERQRSDVAERVSALRSVCQASIASISDPSPRAVPDAAARHLRMLLASMPLDADWETLADTAIDNEWKTIHTDLDDVQAQIRSVQAHIGGLNPVSSGALDTLADRIDAIRVRIANNKAAEMRSCAASLADVCVELLDAVPDDAGALPPAVAKRIVTNLDSIERLVAPASEISRQQ